MKNILGQVTVQLFAYVTWPKEYRPNKCAQEHQKG